MPFGKIFTVPNNPRTTAILAVAKANNLDLEVIEADTSKPTAEHLKASKLGKVPAFLGDDGYGLSECIAIAIYITSQNEKTTLLGKTKQDYASILKWLSFINHEVLPPFGGWYRPLLGKDPYNKKAVEDSSKVVLKAIAVIEEHLKHNTYLVGERITLADLFAAGIVSRGFEFFFDTKWRQENPHVTRWWTTVVNQPIYSAVAQKLELLDAPKLTNVPPKKPEQPKKEKKETPKAAPKAAAKDEEEDDAPPEPKAKHPLDLLPRATFALDDWKRYYSNNDTPDAMKWFWENMNFEEYSLWKVDYKYNEELTLTFMSNNLVGGFNNRLEGSRKFIFGCASVFGTNNDSVIQGAFVVRGQEWKPAFDVAPDYESYDFTKLDQTKDEDKAFVDAQWSWDKPVVKDGKTYPHAAGKVFK